MITTLTLILTWVIYGALAAIALWGTFCVVVVWRRVAETRFRSESEQEGFLAEVHQRLAEGDTEGILQRCEADARAMPQLVLLAINNRDLEHNSLRHLVVDRFQRDVLADLEYRLSWVQTVIRSAPMVGLLGTVVGMMGAFSKLGSGMKIDPATSLAEDISLALITTACGLAIAIPLVLCTASINVQIRKLEDLVGLGLTRFFERLRRSPARGGADAKDGSPRGATEQDEAEQATPLT